MTKHDVADVLSVFLGGNYGTDAEPGYKYNCH